MLVTIVTARVMPACNGRVALKHPEWVTSRMIAKLLQSHRPYITVVMASCNGTNVRIFNGRVALKHPEWVTSRMITKLLQSPGAPDPVAIHGVLRQR
jgi:hypothetical protein